MRFSAPRRFFDGLHARYARRLDWALNHRGPVLLLLGAVILNVFLIVVAPKGLLPQQDTGAMTGGLRVDQSMSFTATSEKLTQAANIIRADPAVATLVAFTGGGRAGGLYVRNLKPRGERPPITDVIARLRPKLARVRGVSVFLNPVQDLQAGGRQTSAPINMCCTPKAPRCCARRGKAGQALKAQPKPSPTSTSTSRTPAPAPLSPSTATAPPPWHCDEHHRPDAL
jgi:multidrug efflux pump